MCTGDNIDTAIAISKQAGIISKKMTVDEEKAKPYMCMTGEDFRERVGGLVEVPDPNNNDKKIKKIKNFKAFKEIAS